jgi:hypothetical protein
VRRPLTAEERAILDHLLTADFPGAVELRRQAAFAEVVGRCPCGCATIEVEVDTVRSPAAEVSDRAPVEALGRSQAFDLLLFVDEGYLSSVEIYGVDDPPSTFPPPSSFEPARAATP